MAQKLFKIQSFKYLGPLVKGFIDKFKSFPEKKKKHHAKIGIKTLLKVMRQFYLAKIANKDSLLSEFVYLEMQKRFGHNKMATKSFIQFIASAYYHMKQHVKADVFCSFLSVNEKPYSNDVLAFFLKVTEGL